ncbi:MAG: cell division protein FtsZ [Rhodoblastus sp.]|nr:MAG: cell division protein FtsZ [Rhodoblastus sp.]
MTINLHAPELRELKPRIMVCGVGGAGGNAVNNMIASGLVGVDFICANTDAQALTSSRAERIVQMGLQATEGLGAGAQPEIGRAAAEEALEELRDHLAGVHMVFVTAGMGGGTGTGAAPVIARMARDMGILTVGVVTKPFQFEGQRRMRIAESGIGELQKSVDTLIVIPNQNLFRVANERTTFADAFSMADQVLYSGVACITDLMVKEGLINLDFADVRAIMREMGKAMMGTGEASGDRRAIMAAEAAIANPLLDETSMKGAKGLLISITGGHDLTLYEVDEAASRIRQEVDEDANIILGATFDEKLEGVIRVSVVATGIDRPADMGELNATEQRIAETAARLRAQAQARQEAAALARAQQQPVETQDATGSGRGPTRSGVRSDPAPQSHAAPATHAAIAAAQACATRAGLCATRAGLCAPGGAVRDLRAGRAADLRRARDGDRELRAAGERSGLYRPHVYEAQDETYQPAPRAAPVEQPMRPARMPTIEQLTLPGQRIAQPVAQVPAPQANPVEAKRRTLLDRLSNWGMSRGDAEHAAPPAPPRPVSAAPSSVHAEYAKRPSQSPQGRLDATGRETPRAHRDEDHLDIPAFLRRQSS